MNRFDDNDIGEAEGWYLKDKSYSRQITVPFCYQSELSGIKSNEMHEIMWYKREFICPVEFSGKRIFLNFGAVDYEAKIWVNDSLVTIHRGGYVPFKVDITDKLTSGTNTIAVKAVDRYDCVQPRGKQYWKQSPERCWYTATSGIWQTVWLESSGELHIDRIRITPDIDNKNALLEIFLNKNPLDEDCNILVTFKGSEKLSINLKLKDRITRVTLNLKEEDYIYEIHYWTPENPNLYDLQLTVYQNGSISDCISSYFGMRKLSVEGNNIFLNNKPYYLKMILDQGYWHNSLMTPPSDDALRFDVEMTKKLSLMEQENTRK